MTTTPKPRPIHLDADGRKRLRASIAHWKRLATGKQRAGEEANSDHCALCARWFDDDCVTSSTDACPVYQATGRSFCHRSPFDCASRAATRHGLASPEFRAAAEVELAFLRDLLARAKEKP